jgi:hypothetical protein
MTTRNLSAIAVSACLTVITALSGLAPAQADGVRVTCNTRPGDSTTIALNGGESIPFGSWSVSDAIDVAYAVKNNCQKPTGQTVNAANYRIKVNSTPNTVKVKPDESDSGGKPTPKAVEPSVLW